MMMNYQNLLWKKLLITLCMVVIFANGLVYDMAIANDAILYVPGQDRDIGNTTNDQIISIEQSASINTDKQSTDTINPNTNRLDNLSTSSSIGANRWIDNFSSAIIYTTDKIQDLTIQNTSDQITSTPKAVLTTDRDISSTEEILYTPMTSDQIVDRNTSDDIITPTITTDRIYDIYEDGQITVYNPTDSTIKESDISQLTSDINNTIRDIDTIIEQDIIDTTTQLISDINNYISQDKTMDDGSSVYTPSYNNPSDIYANADIKLDGNIKITIPTDLSISRIEKLESNKSNNDITTYEGASYMTYSPGGDITIDEYTPERNISETSLGSRDLELLEKNADISSKELGNTISDTSLIEKAFEFGIEGEDLIFSKPIKIEVNVDTSIDKGNVVNLYTKHASDDIYNTVGLSTHPDTMCDSEGNATIPSSVTAPVDGKIVFWTCRASSYVMQRDRINYTFTKTVTLSGSTLLYNINIPSLTGATNLIVFDRYKAGGGVESSINILTGTFTISATGGCAATSTSWTITGGKVIGFNTFFNASCNHKVINIYYNAQIRYPYSGYNVVNHVNVTNSGTINSDILSDFGNNYIVGTPINMLPVGNRFSARFSETYSGTLCIAGPIWKNMGNNTIVKFNGTDHSELIAEYKLGYGYYDGTNTTQVLRSHIPINGYPEAKTFRFKATESPFYIGLTDESIATDSSHHHTEMMYSVRFTTGAGFTVGYSGGSHTSISGSWSSGDTFYFHITAGGAVSFHNGSGAKIYGRTSPGYGNRVIDTQLGDGEESTVGTYVKDSVFLDLACAGINICGDGITGGVEECDDGDNNNSNGCSNSCTIIQNGACGPLHGTGIYDSTTTGGSLNSGNIGLCNAGTVTGFVYSGGAQKWFWNCQGIGTGASNASCNADRLYCGGDYITYSITLPYARGENCNGRPGTGCDPGSWIYTYPDNDAVGPFDQVPVKDLIINGVNLGLSGTIVFTGGHNPHHFWGYAGYQLPYDNVPYANHGVNISDKNTFIQHVQSTLTGSTVTVYTGASGVVVQIAGVGNIGQIGMIYDDHYNKPMDWTLTGTMAQYCAPSCGDGMINQTGEQCDLGTGNGSTGPCSASCTFNTPSCPAFNFTVTPTTGVAPKLVTGSWNTVTGFVATTLYRGTGSPVSSPTSPAGFTYTTSGNYTAVLTVANNLSGAITNNCTVNNINISPTPINGACGTGNNIKVYTGTTPSGLCSAGTSASLTQTSTGWSWSCVGLYSGTTASCQAPKGYCGDGTIGTGLGYSGQEQCDDGNGVNTDACSNTCQLVSPSCAAFNFAVTPTTGTVPRPVTGNWNTVTGFTVTRINWTPTVFVNSPSKPIGYTYLTAGNYTAYITVANSLSGGMTTTCSVNLNYINAAVNGVCGDINGGDIYDFDNSGDALTGGYAGLCSTGTVSSFAYNSSTHSWSWSCVGLYSGTTASCSVSELYCGDGVVNSTGMTEDGLIGYWSFDSDNANDDSGNGHHGTLNGGVGFTGGVAGRAAMFDGVDDYISFGDRDIDVPEFTVSLWTKLSGTPPSHVKNIIGKGDRNTSNNWYLGYKNTNAISFSYGTGRAGPSYHLSSYNEEEWHHLVGVATTTSQRLYLDGVLVASVNTSHTGVSNNYNLEIGRSSYYANFMSGLVDDIRIYDRALTTGEILNLSNLGEQCDLGTGNGPNSACSTSCTYNNPICANFNFTASATTGYVPKVITGSWTTQSGFTVNKITWTPTISGTSPANPTGYNYTVSGNYNISINISNNLSGAFSGSCTIPIQLWNAPINGACGAGSGVMVYTGTTPTGLCSAGTSASLTQSSTGWTWTCQGQYSGSNASCSAPKGYCGDGTIGTGLGYAGQEQCDLGTGNGPNSTSACSLTCQLNTPSCVAHNFAITPTTGTVPRPVTGNWNTVTGFTVTNLTWTTGVNISGSPVTSPKTYTYLTAGNYTAYITVANSLSGSITTTCSVPLQFLNAPVNGACGDINGNSIYDFDNSGDALTGGATGLCAIGTVSGFVYNAGTHSWSWTCMGAFSGTNASCSVSELYCGDGVVNSTGATSQNILISKNWGTNATGNNNSLYPHISSDSRYIVYQSNATNIVTGDSSTITDIYVYDKFTKTTQNITSGSNNHSNGSIKNNISADGRYVTFQSSATNLVGGDTNGYIDVFVYDRQTSTMTNITLGGNNVSDVPTISADGRYVSFRSQANNLVPGDINGYADVFVYDRQTSTMTNITLGGNNVSYYPSISADGRYVVSYTNASNLFTDTNGGAQDVFVYDMQTQTFENINIGSNGYSQFPSISADGRYVVYQSNATNLVAGDTNGVFDIFLYDRQTSTTKNITISGSFESQFPSISADGRYIGFQTISSFVPGDTNGKQDVYVYDTHTQEFSSPSLWYGVDNNVYNIDFSSDGRSMVYGALGKVYANYNNIEYCDDGNGVNTDACSNSCQLVTPSCDGWNFAITPNSGNAPRLATGTWTVVTGFNVSGLNWGAGLPTYTSPNSGTGYTYMSAGNYTGTLIIRNNLSGSISTQCTVNVSYSAVNGVCGSVNGSDIYDFDAGGNMLTGGSSGLCASGSIASFGYDGGTHTWSWTCIGTGGGSNISCSADELYCGDNLAGSGVGYSGQEQCDLGDDNGSGSNCSLTCQRKPQIDIDKDTDRSKYFMSGSDPVYYVTLGDTINYYFTIENNGINDLNSGNMENRFKNFEDVSYYEGGTGMINYLYASQLSLDGYTLVASSGAWCMPGSDNYVDGWTDMPLGLATPWATGYHGSRLKEPGGMFNSTGYINAGGYCTYKLSLNVEGYHNTAHSSWDDGCMMIRDYMSYGYDVDNGGPYTDINNAPYIDTCIYRPQWTIDKKIGTGLDNNGYITGGNTFIVGDTYYYQVCATLSTASGVVVDKVNIKDTFGAGLTGTINSIVVSDDFEDGDMNIIRSGNQALFVITGASIMSGETICINMSGTITEEISTTSSGFFYNDACVGNPSSLSGDDIIYNYIQCANATGIINRPIDGQCGSLSGSIIYDFNAGGDALTGGTSGLCLTGTVTNLNYNSGSNTWSWSCDGLYNGSDMSCGASESYCGNGILGTGIGYISQEQCDDGNGVNTDACSNTCQLVAPSCPAFGFTVTPTTGTVPRPVTGNWNTVTGFTVTNLTWTTGVNISGSPVTSPKTYTYLTAGNYTATLTVANSLSGSITTTCSVPLQFLNAPVNGVCGDINGGDIYDFDNSGDALTGGYAGLCSTGTVSSFAYNSSTHTWSWTCLGQYSGSNASCSVSELYCGDGIVNSTGATSQDILISKNPNTNATGNNTSVTPRISADGNIIVFESTSTNLVTGDTNGRQDVFVYDKSAKSLINITISGNNISRNARVSADGNLIIFESNASNLVAGDTNSHYDIFLYNRLSGTTTRITNANQAGRGSFNSNISADGKWVVIQSQVSGFTGGDSNGATQDIYLYNIASGTFRMITPPGGNNNSTSPSVSKDGRYVGFNSVATNLVAGDTNGVQDGFIYDTQTSTLRRVTNGNAAAWITVSPNGDIAIVNSAATNLVAGDTNGVQDVFIYSRSANAIIKNITQSGNGNSTAYNFSPDGRYIVLTSLADNLVVGDTNGVQDVFIYDLVLDTFKNITPTKTTASTVSDTSFGGAYTTYVSNGNQIYLSYGTTEYCDDGNDDNNDACSNSCTINIPTCTLTITPTNYSGASLTSPANITGVFSVSYINGYTSNPGIDIDRGNGNTAINQPLVGGSYTGSQTYATSLPNKSFTITGIILSGGSPLLISGEQITCIGTVYLTYSGRNNICGDGILSGSEQCEHIGYTYCSDGTACTTDAECDGIGDMSCQVRDVEDADNDGIGDPTFDGSGNITNICGPFDDDCVPYTLPGCGFETNACQYLTPSCEGINFDITPNEGPQNTTVTGTWEDGPSWVDILSLDRGTGTPVSYPISPANYTYTTEGYYTGALTIANILSTGVTTICEVIVDIRGEMCISSPELISFGATQSQSSTGTLTIQSDYFQMKDRKGADSGYYTTLELSDFISTNGTISNDRIEWKAVGLTLLDGNTNASVLMHTSMDSRAIANGTNIFIYRSTGPNNDLRSTYGSKLDLRISVPPYTTIGTYSGTITYTLYEY